MRTYLTFDDSIEGDAEDRDYVLRARRMRGDLDDLRQEVRNALKHGASRGDRDALLEAARALLGRLVLGDE